MKNHNSILDVSIYYPDKLESISMLKKLRCNPNELMVYIRLDSLDAQNEKRVQLELIYDAIIATRLNQTLKSAKELYTAVILLISLERQRLYEIKPTSRIEDWIFIRIIPSTNSNPDCMTMISAGL